MIKGNKFLTVQDLVLIAVFTALISVCAMIQIPTVPVPVTLQTFAVFVVAGVLGIKRGTVSIIAYILLGMVGLPVFRGAGGLGVIVGPTGGYIIGFIFTVIVVNLFMYFIKSENPSINNVVMIIAMILGDVACFVMGTIQFVFVTKTTWAVAIGYCVAPFIIPDLVKIIIAVPVINRIKKNISILK